MLRMVGLITFFPHGDMNLARTVARELRKLDEKPFYVYFCNITHVAGRVPFQDV